jgi:hypothetical protein
MTPTTDLETALLDAHYQGDPVARFAWLGWCEDNGVRLTEVGITGVWRGTLADWLEVGPGLVRRVALERVELSDREPEYDDEHADWIREELAGKYSWFAYQHLELPYALPAAWFRKRDWYPYDTRQDAIDDASRRAIRWARGQGQRQEVRG